MIREREGESDMKREPRKIEPTRKAPPLAQTDAREAAIRYAKENPEIQYALEAMRLIHKVRPPKYPQSTYVYRRIGLG